LNVHELGFWLRMSRVFVLRLRVDDPVNGISVHGAGGLLGKHTISLDFLKVYKNLRIVYTSYQTYMPGNL
jgi:hypothetical protein